jgi:hypothetical protein
MTTLTVADGGVRHQSCADPPRGCHEERHSTSNTPGESTPKPLVARATWIEAMPMVLTIVTVGVASKGGEEGQRKAETRAGAWHDRPGRPAGTRTTVASWRRCAEA